ncbi:M23 family metallopeptidase [Sphingosinicella sp. LHD-64]|uniref:M23 family metallopeptidase n=1 Tax=Sphingosinicella sp. LHD-64 TaxID=3072139 RepID=UPI00280D48C9|nr:M23 family metallopeptidase [Sphingosinicella sp. LHD-64]MDQ8757986.1 M23 family metallopeptidase [Sphingosinicella sp. LHD-64]
MLLTFASLLSLSTAVALRAAPAEVRPYQSLDLEVPCTPSVARIDGDDRLVYELHATNFSGRTLTLTAVEVRDAASGAEISRIDPAGMMRRIGAEGGDARSLAPGQRAILYLSVPWAGRSTAPLTHRITFDAAREGAATDRVTIVGGSVTPTPAVTTALGAPLRGGPWTAVYLPDHDNGHRRFPYAVSGRVRLPGRHAIDWMPARGFVSASAGASAADGSGADVLAVADAEVVAVKEPAAPGAPRNVEDETGAMIVLRLPDGRFAHYQHLEPGLRLSVGTTVRRGQVIAQVGSSGHVTQPHLHFHVSDGVRPLDSEGLPYRFGAGRIFGRYASDADFDNGVAWQPAPARPIDGLPAPGSVIVFDRE